MVENYSQIYEHLAFIYEDEKANQFAAKLIAKLEAFKSTYPKLSASKHRERFCERDAILITYGDMVNQPGKRGLRVLADFLRKHVNGAISTVHILPFFPYSSDDGFSVIDYKKVAPELGTWEDVDYLSNDYRLMFDAVINHVSSQSDWFRGYLSNDPDLQEYFITITPEMDLSNVFRPRALPLATRVKTSFGDKLVWTTFSADQIDLNYKNPQLLMEVIDVLLYYVRNGAEFIRLDAIAFIWKESGTTCIHLAQAHRIVQLMRTILDIIAPHVSLITETNVPHEENISYFGDGSNEAQMVYNFSLPPLTLHAFYTGNAKALSEWANTLELPSKQTTFFNFLASHDGIGVTPARGILTQDEITAMGVRVRANGGYISYKNNADGSQSAYELNINYLDALLDPHHEEDLSTFVRRFLCSQAIMLSLQGLPGIYFHSLFGSRNWYQGVEQTGRYRSINRQKPELEHLEEELCNKESLRHMILHGYLDLLKQRTSHPAFHPAAIQKVLFLNASVFSLWRGSLDHQSGVICLHNVSNQPQGISIDMKVLPIEEKPYWVDLFTKQRFASEAERLILDMRPYEVKWLSSQ